MADTGRWFKLWICALNDPDLDNLTIADFGRWCKFGAYLKEQGNDGEIDLKEPSRSLCSKLQVDNFNVLINKLKIFPNVTVSCETNSPVSCRVKWENWSKYQGDISTYRVRKHRAKKRQNETPKKRREEKRREEKKKRRENIDKNTVSIFIGKYCESFKSLYGINPHITPKDSGIAKRLILIPDIDFIMQKFFKSKDKFIVDSRHSLSIVESQINKVLTDSDKAKFSGIKEWLEEKEKENETK